LTIAVGLWALGGSLSATEVQLEDGYATYLNEVRTQGVQAGILVRMRKGWLIVPEDFYVDATATESPVFYRDPATPLVYKPSSPFLGIVIGKIEDWPVDQAVLTGPPEWLGGISVQGVELVPEGRVRQESGVSRSVLIRDDSQYVFVTGTDESVWRSILYSWHFYRQSTEILDRDGMETGMSGPAK
jgi:hypothetical protein